MLFSLLSYGQELSLPAYGQEYKDLELVQADHIDRQAVYKGRRANKFAGNVEFRQNDIYFYCDTAYQILGEDAPMSIEAIGNVRVIKAEAYTFTGDFLAYKPGDKAAIMRGNVFLREKRRKKDKEKRRKYLKYKLK